MSGWWVTSYWVLWALVVAEGVLLTGVLRRLGALELQRGAATGPSVVPVEHDGPRLGSPLPALGADTTNGFGRVTSGSLSGSTGGLLVFLNAGCDSCQRVAAALDDLACDATAVPTVVVMHAEEETCRTFLSVFRLRVPVICDKDRTLTAALGVHRSPFGLLYGPDGRLHRKGAIAEPEHLRALIDGEPLADDSGQIFPPPGRRGIGLTASRQ